MIQWGHVITTYDLSNTSDHSPILLKNRKIPEGLMAKVREKHNALKHVLKRLNKEEFLNIT
ncbi:hypothetical protein H5410_046726 [Solanum commersonii]|uniref:Uncharacterized protein n=1 Tax=Solanum commersonii TaxID=4109 RepID=A0A9J5XGA8_SOLCO|nr:hypothetical protein H5410_046726 [Solanum commersonii]